MLREKRLQRCANVVGPRSAFSRGQIDERVDALEYRCQMAAGPIDEEHHVVEAFATDSDDTQIDGELIAGTDFADKVGVVLQIHSPGFAASVAAIVESDGGIERIARVIEHSQQVTDVHMIVAVCPFSSCDGFVAGPPQFLNLFCVDRRRLQRIPCSRS